MKSQLSMLHVICVLQLNIFCIFTHNDVYDKLLCFDIILYFILIHFLMVLHIISIVDIVDNFEINLFNRVKMKNLMSVHIIINKLYPLSVKYVMEVLKLLCSLFIYFFIKHYVYYKEL